MKSILVCCVLSMISYACKGQIDALKFGAPIKWELPIVKHGIFYRSGIDTLTLDTVRLTKNGFLRVSENGILREEIVIDPSARTYGCMGCEGYRISGFWKAYYDNGDIKEIGVINCNRKVDEWMYYHPNGRLRKYENYLRLDIVSEFRDFGFLSGLSKEYYENGKVKSSGTYKIVEALQEYVVFDIESYEEIHKCCMWNIISIKHGLWTEYDDSGKVVFQKDESIDVDASDQYRDITDGYLEREETMNVRLKGKE